MKDLHTVSDEQIQGDARWLRWARKIQAISQSGLAFTENPYDRERYEELTALAAEIIAEHATLDHERTLSIYRGEKGYATPKVDVRGAVFRDDRLLMVRETIDGCWTLPGGWADVNDTPAEAVEREIREEAGFEARVSKLVAALDRDRQGHPAFLYSVYKLFFICDLVGGEAKTSLETDGVDFFALDALPPLSKGRITRSQIELVFHHYENPDAPAVFE